MIVVINIEKFAFAWSLKTVWLSMSGCVSLERQMLKSLQMNCVV